MLLDYGPSQSSQRSEYTGQYSSSASLRALPNYVHRHHLETQMKERLHDTLEEERDSSRLLVLCGLGGAGKSSLALNYLLSYRKDYSAVFWLHAVSEESLQKECEEIHGLLHEHVQFRSNNNIDGVKRWFQGRRSRYLWILDSADNVDNISLERYIPDASCIDVIVTTRSQSAQHMSSLPAVPVAELDQTEAQSLFTQRAGMSDLTPQAEQDVVCIVECLGHFALAVKLAGAYIASNPHLKARLGEYLSQLRVDQSGLLNQQPQRHVDRYERSIQRAWGLSCDAIASKSSAALNLLSFLAFMDPDCIKPEHFEGGGNGVTTANKHTDLRWRTAISEQEPWTEGLHIAFATLLDYSLIQWSNEKQYYNMHQLVHSWTFDRLSNSEVHLFGTAVLLMRKGGAVTCARACLKRLASIPDASSSDRLITLNRFGTLGAYNETTQSDTEADATLCFKFESSGSILPQAGVMDRVVIELFTCHGSLE
jgi:hypothetical protein